MVFFWARATTNDGGRHCPRAPLPQCATVNAPAGRVAREGRGEKGNASLPRHKKREAKSEVCGTSAFFSFRSRVPAARALSPSPQARRSGPGATGCPSVARGGRTQEKDGAPTRPPFGLAGSARDPALPRRRPPPRREREREHRERAAREREKRVAVFPSSSSLMADDLERAVLFSFDQTGAVAPELKAREIEKGREGIGGRRRISFFFRFDRNQPPLFPFFFPTSPAPPPTSTPCAPRPTAGAGA